MNPSRNCYELVKHYESLRLEAYLCPAGIPTNGYGHTKGVKLGQTCTPDQADAWLREDMQDAVDAVNKYINGSLTQGQFDALVSFTFNLGAGAFRESTLRKLVNAGRFDAAAGEFKKWVYSKGQVLSGLTKRRAAESWLFKTGTLRLVA